MADREKRERGRDVCEVSLAGILVEAPRYRRVRNERPMCELKVLCRLEVRGEIVPTPFHLFVWGREAEEVKDYEKGYHVAATGQVWLERVLATNRWTLMVEPDVVSGAPLAAGAEAKHFANINMTGNLVQDAELRRPRMFVVCNGRLAGKIEVCDPKTGEWTVKRVRPRFAIWGPRGEKLASYLPKGRQLTIRGRMRLGQWIDERNGSQHAAIEVTPRRVTMHFGRAGKRDAAEGRDVKVLLDLTEKQMNEIEEPKPADARADRARRRKATAKGVARATGGEKSRPAGPRSADPRSADKPGSAPDEATASDGKEDQPSSTGRADGKSVGRKEKKSAGSDSGLDLLL